MIDKDLLNNKITFSIFFFIVGNLIFNHEYIYYFIKDSNQIDFSIFTDKWQLGQYLCTYKLEFAKRCFNGTIFDIFNIKVSFEKIYLYNLIIFNCLIFALIALINKIESNKTIIFLYSIFLFSPFSFNSFANLIAASEPQLYLLLSILILINLKNKEELFFSSIISISAILIHEISFFVLFPIIFFIKFQNCYPKRKFNSLILFSSANILTYIMIIFFGGLSQENGLLLYDQIIEIKDQNFNTARIYLTSIFEATSAYTKPTIIRNVLNLNIPVLFVYIFINYFFAYKIFTNLFELDKGFLSLVKLFFLFLAMLVIYFLLLGFFDQIIEFFLKRNPSGAPLLKDIVLKISFIIFVIISFYILHLYGFMKLINEIYKYSNFLLFLSPILILLIYAVGSAYGRYVAYLLINLTFVSVYFLIEFKHVKLNTKYFIFWLMINFTTFAFVHIHDEGFSGNYSKLPLTIIDY